MTAQEVADYLRLSKRWVYAKASSGELPSVRIGRSVRFHRDEIDAFVRGEQPDNVVHLTARGQ